MEQNIEFPLDESKSQEAEKCVVVLKAVCLERDAERSYKVQRRNAERIAHFPALPDLCKKESVEAVKNVLQGHIPERRVRRRIAEQIVDTPALPDVEEHVFKVFSQERVQQREVKQEVLCGAGWRLSSSVACRSGNAGRRPSPRVVCRSGAGRRLRVGSETLQEGAASKHERGRSVRCCAAPPTLSLMATGAICSHFGGGRCRAEKRTCRAFLRAKCASHVSGGVCSLLFALCVLRSRHSLSSIGTSLCTSSVDPSQIGEQRAKSPNTPVHRLQKRKCSPRTLSNVCFLQTRVQTR